MIPLAAMWRAPTSARGGDPQLHALLDALPAAVYTVDTEGRITYYNPAAAALWGQRPRPDDRQWCGAWKLYRPDGTPMAHAECPTAIAVKEGRAVRDMEALAERPDGTRVPFIFHPTPLHDEAGRLTGAVDMLVDLTERKRAEEQQALLIRELHHRVKNTLAIVQAIMGSTARSTETIEDFKTALIGRIASLARTHRLLADEQRPVTLGDILRAELDAFDDGNDGRIILSGPQVDLSTRLAVSLGMAIHELAINSARYGALSVYGGRVEAKWSLTVESDRRVLAFDWMESGGPPVEPPLRRGFGTQLLEVVLPGQIQAETRIDYAREGVCVHYTVPLPANA